MANLAGVLADIPGLAGYTAQSQMNDQRTMGNLQQAGGALGLMETLRKHQQELQFRDAMSKATTPEQQLAIASQFGGPAAIMAHADRQAKTENSKQIALQNLNQKIATELRHVYEFAQTLPLNQRKVAILDAQAKAAQLRAAGSLAIQKGNLDYNVGGDTSGIGDIISQLRSGAAGAAMGAQAPAGPVAAPGQPQWGPMAAGTPPQVQDAAAQIRANLAQGGPGGTIDLGVLQPQAAAPEAATAPPSAPAAPNNLDARDLGAHARGPVAAPTTPIATPGTPAPAAGPQMPQFTGSPRQVADAQNRWRLAQAKGGEAGGKASESVVDAIVQGRMPVPTGFALRSPYWQDVIERVSAKDPNFDASRYIARSAARRTFASGPEARNVTAINTLVGHLGTLDEAAQALNNSDVMAVNAVANRLATEMGDPRIQNFDTAKQAVAEETMRVFRGVGASEKEAEQWGRRITSSGSPVQLRAVIGTLGKLLDSRVEAIGQQYERTVNNPGNPARIDPKNRVRLDELSAPGWSDDKERRYQELLRKRGGGS